MASARTQMREPAFKGYGVMRVVCVVAPILFGLDKFCNWMVYWPRYLAPWPDRIMSGNAPQYYDIALRDFGLMAGALTLNRLAVQYQGRMMTAAREIASARKAA